VLDCLNALPAHQLLENRDDYVGASFDWENATSAIEDAKVKLGSLLSPTPTPRDDIIRASGLPTPIVNAALLELELNAEISVEADGRIAQLY